MQRVSNALGVAVVLCALTLFFWPGADPAHVTTLRASALVLFAVGLWATSALPEYLVALAFLFLTAISAVVPPEVVFSGFTTSTLWLVFGGLILAEAVSASGLGQRLASRLLGRFSATYRRALIGTMLVTTVLCFVMPATIARILLMVPILIAFCQRLGLPPGSRGFNGIMLVMLIGSFQVGAAILPSNIPNLVLAGSAESLYGVEILYLEYLTLHFPVLGVAKAVLTVAMIERMFRADVAPVAAAAPLPPMAAAEWRMAIILGCALALWATDFLHHIRPGWIGLGAGLACLLPRIGLIDIHAFNERVKLAPFFYIGAVLGVGALINAAELSATLGAGLPTWLGLEPGADFWNFQLLSLLSTVTVMVATSPGQPALLGPLAAEFAAATGWDVRSVLMTFAIGFSTILLPYQVPPVVVGLYAAGVPSGQAARVFVIQAGFTVMLLWPLNFVWWWLLGYFAR
ncbi:MAG: SLC13 family permease [Proteobacteria bacterium]|nr:SLC13 family permease [Burkholderiales bacterium]